MLIIAKSRATLVRLLFSGVLGLFFAGCQPAGPKALLNGERLIQEGDYRGALKSLKVAAELIPQNPQVWNHLGLAYHGMGNTLEAANAYRRALTIDRNLSPVYFNLGNLFLEENRLPEAMAALTSYTLLNPKDPQGWTKLGVAQLRAKKPDEAERSIVNGLKLAPKDPELHNNYGLVHLHRKRPREALQEFNFAIQADPKYGPALLNQAVLAHYHLGNKQAALDRYRAYVALRPTPENAPEIRRVIDGLELELQPRETTPVVVANLEPRPRETPPVLPPPAATNVVAQKPAAPAPTNVVIQRDPEKTQPPPTVAAVSTNRPPPTNVVATAPPVTQPAVPTVAPVTPPKTNLVAANSTPPTSSQNPPPAQPKPEEPPAEPLVSVAITGEPDIKPVRDILDKPVQTAAAKTQQTDPAPGTGIVPPEKPLFAPRPRKEDSGVLEKINPMSWFKDKEEKAPPRNQLAYRNPNTTPTNQARPLPPATARPFIKENLEISATPAPEPPPLPRYPYKKNLQLAKGQTTEAERLFQLGAQAQAEKRYGAAIDLYQQAISRDPSYFQAYYNLGIVAYQLKDLPLALGANEQAVHLKAGNIDARFNFALTLRDANYPVDAANELRELLVDAPDEVRAHFMLANLYAQKLNQPFLARRHYEKVLQIDPRHREASNIRYWLAANQ